MPALQWETPCDRCGEKACCSVGLHEERDGGKKFIYAPREFCDECYHELLAVFERPLRSEEDA